MPSFLISSQISMRRSFACLWGLPGLPNPQNSCAGGLRLRHRLSPRTKGPRGCTRANGSGLNGNPRKNGSRRSRPLPGHAHERLRTWKALRGDWYAGAGKSESRPEKRRARQGPFSRGPCSSRALGNSQITSLVGSGLNRESLHRSANCSNLILVQLAFGKCRMIGG